MVFVYPYAHNNRPVPNKFRQDPLLILPFIHFRNMFPMSDSRVPGHQFLHFLMGRRFIQIRKHGQNQYLILVRLNTIGLSCFNQLVHNGSEFHSLDTVTEQPVLSVDYEGTDRILGSIIGDRCISMVQ